MTSSSGSSARHGLPIVAQPAGFLELLALARQRRKMRLPAPSRRVDQPGGTRVVEP